MNARRYKDITGSVALGNADGILFANISEVISQMNTRTLRTCLIWAAVATAYYFWFQSLYNAVRFDTLFPYTGVSDMLIGIAYNMPPIMLMFICNLLIVFRLNWIKSLRLKIVADIVLSLSVQILVNWGYMMAISLSHPAEIDWAGTFLNDVIILMIIETVYYFHHLSKSQKEAEDARLKAMQFQFDSLKSQINPHFLFNSLNILYSLVSIDAVRSKEFIRDLSSIYRYILAQHERQTVKATEEFEFLNSYISVLRIRYGNKISVTINGTPDSEADMIPFTLQLLMENVIKHNVITSKRPMEVSICITGKGITVSNPVYPRETEHSGRFGLHYLCLLYGNYGRRFYIDKSDSVFTAHIPFL